MTRTLTSNIQAQISASGSAPIYFARLDIGGGVGTKWIADRDLGAADGSSWDNAVGCVASWGAILARQCEDPRYNPIGDTDLDIIDHDKTWHDWCLAAEFQNKRARIYLSFDGLAESDLTLIFDGIINDSPRWSDDMRRFTLQLTDASTRRNRTIGTLADVNTFSALGQECCDTEIVPIVFGAMKRSPCVPADVAPTCRLAVRCLWNDTKIYVDDAGRFPQNTTIRIRIENEIIEGYFTGNTFHATARHKDEVTAGTIDAPVDEYSFDDLDLSPNSGAYVGYYVEVSDAGIFGGVGWRRIAAYDGAKRRVFFDVPFIRNGSPWVLPAGRSYKITSRSHNSYVLAHPAGAMVHYAQNNMVYIVADHPCKAVDAVEGYGDVQNYEGESDNISKRGDPNFIRLDPDWYTVNTNDTTSFPDLGHAVTTITLSKMPRELIPALESNRLWADVRGVETNGDGTGTLIENPADIIKELLANPRWGDIESGGYDAASFSTAASRLAYLKMAFSITSRRELLELVADLAWQARSALNWNDGVAVLTVLDNEAQAGALTLDADDIVLNSIRREYTSLRDVVSEISAVYQDRLEQKRVRVRDEGVESSLGRRVAERRFWAYRTKNNVINAASFWLHRMKMLYEIVRLRCFLDALSLERNDTVTLDYPTLFSAGQKGIVIETRHNPGGGEIAEPPVIDLALRLPRYPGCASNCEANCESGGCESGCEFACEEGAEACWQCETACESQCEITGCTTTSEIWCTTMNVGCSESGACGACETACTTSCELDTCETGCETSCETGCEVSCETGCEVACQAGCEISCETTCETSCETGAETSGGCSYSDDFTVANFSTNWPDQADTHPASANDWFRDAANNRAEWDGNYAGWHGRLAYYKDSCDSDDHDVTVTVAAGESSWRSGAVGRGNGSDTCYAADKTDGNSCELRKIVNGTRTTLDQVGSFYASTFTLRVNGTSISAYTTDPGSPIASVTDSDIPTGKRMGIMGIGGTTSVKAYVTEWSTSNV